MSGRRFSNPGHAVAGAKGAATVYVLLFTLLIVGFLVLATDVGRMYVIQGEIQTAADAAALAAATQLAGTTNAGIHATTQIDSLFDTATGNDNRFNFRLNQIGAGATNLATTTTVDYFAALADALANVNGGQNGSIDWTTGVYPKYVRLQITAQAPVMFVPLLNRSVNLPTVAASAVAGVSAPVCSATGIDGLAVIDPSAGDDPLNFGLVPGGFYTLFLTPSQQTPNAPVTPAPLLGTVSSVQYALLDHLPAGPQNLDTDASLFDIGAAGLLGAPNLTPPANITIDAAETAYQNLVGNISAGTSVGRNLLCGLNTRFGVDPAINVCGTVVNGEFLTLAPLFRADADLGADTYAAGDGLQDFAAEYDGNMRRVLTVPVIDSALTVLNFRQFLLEMSPVSPTIVQGVNPALNTGAFRAQYIGAPVPLRSGSVGGTCRVTLGVGRVVLH